MLSFFDEQAQFAWTQPEDSMSALAPTGDTALGTTPMDATGGPYQIWRGPMTPTALVAWLANEHGVSPEIQSKPIGPAPQPPTIPNEVIGSDDFVYRPPQDTEITPFVPMERRVPTWSLTETGADHSVGPTVQVDAADNAWLIALREKVWSLFDHDSATGTDFFL